LSQSVHDLEHLGPVLDLLERKLGVGAVTMVVELATADFFPGRVEVLR
jgi:hypothetical protein